jgi:CBS domain-containing protein
MAHSTLDASSLEFAHGLLGRTVSEAMLRVPKVLGAGSRVGDAVALFQDDHVHAALVVDAEERLLVVVERADLVGRSSEEQLTTVGQLGGRTVGAAADLKTAWLAMRGLGRRRVAVVDGPAGQLVGLLCLKRSGLGFCSDADVADRGPLRGC